MCGIAAIVSARPRALEPIDAMTDELRHRGPDDRGSLILEREGVALGMRRLSIIDVAGGHQPMWDENEAFCVVFNGEIYNAAELRAELVARGHRFHTDHSDTEVLVHGFDEWDVDLFRRLNGMFAFALWDRHRERLVLARDRAGEKPLYVGDIEDGYVIGSELKSLLRHPELKRDVDFVALQQYLSFDWSIGPRSMLRGVRKLLAGHYAIVTPDGYESKPYWTPSVETRFHTEADALAALDHALDESVRMRMIADVPVGLFLSGGMDSTTVGYYMRRHSDTVHSYSIGFEEAEYDESEYAALAARTLGTDHHCEIFSQDRVRDLIPKVADILDEPMGDASILPTHLLSVFARRDVTVALGGDGSDELLLGYKAYQPLKVAWELERRIPHALQRAIAGSARRTPTHLAQRQLRGVVFARRFDESPVARLLGHLGQFKGNGDWLLAAEHRSELPLAADEPQRVLLDGVNGVGADHQTVIAYLRGYLQEDILVKVDRASMATSLEVRAPFLDPNVIDVALAIAPHLRMKRLARKHILRQLMRGRVPDQILDRPKVGFGVPLSLWLRESLAPMVRDYLAPDRVAAAGIFDPVAVTKVVDEHLSGVRDRGHQVWLLLQFELWRERWLT
jgi:asparagine synthase (glutamine-hydrolysing)